MWEIIDPLYYACSRLRYIGSGDQRSGIFRVRLILYKGTPISLSDGTLIQKGNILLKNSFT
ncbi:YkoP family protein [Paenibacillus sp. PvR148]